MLNLLEDKARLTHERDSVRYVYLPAGDAEEASRGALGLQVVAR